MKFVVGAIASGSPQVTIPQLRPLHAADKLPPLIIKGHLIIKEGSVDKLCQDVAHLAQEFRSHPHGRHSVELQRVLNRMRSEPFVGHYVLVQEHGSMPYRLARLGRNPVDPISYTGDTFMTLEEAEWAVFKLRWRALYGSDLSAESGG
ncbi:MAG TPA: hypothetical protein VFE34_10230 [Dongiaceae bacterium]|jgi:hypothetical protein|nr:hypothetical protein [Dongiaceae bacterium]